MKPQTKPFVVEIKSSRRSSKTGMKQHWSDADLPRLTAKETKGIPGEEHPQTAASSSDPADT